PTSPATPASSPLSLHDALPISARAGARLRSSRLQGGRRAGARASRHGQVDGGSDRPAEALRGGRARLRRDARPDGLAGERRLLLDRKSTRLNSSHLGISYAVFW